MTELKDTRGLEPRRRNAPVELAWSIVKTAPYATLATADLAGNPFAVAVNAFDMDGAVYFHATKDMKSRKAQNMRMNNRVCLFFIGEAELVPERFSAVFKSAVVEGAAEVVTDPEEISRCVRAMVDRHAPGTTPEAFGAYLARVPIPEFWRVTVENITAKERVRSW